MKIFNNLNISKKYKSSAIAIGNFDGIHRGHQKVFIETKKYAKKIKVKFGVLTFTPLPAMFFNKKIKNFRLNSDQQKLSILKKHKVDFVINIPFNKKFSNISAENFIKKYIFKKINPKLIAVSNNFKFGKNRIGNLNLIKKSGNNFNYKLLNIKPFKYLGKNVSSTKIRNYLKSGNIDLANNLLSRTWFIEGHVKKGKKIGRKLGYRTCNISIKKYVVPKIGIYAVKVSIENKKNIYGGVAYIGSRPTFNGKDILLEINIFRINKNLYGKKLRIYFLKFLRNDKKFANSSQLVRQMNKDLIFAKKALKEKLAL